MDEKKKEKKQTVLQKPKEQNKQSKGENKQNKIIKKLKENKRQNKMKFQLNQS